MLRNRKKRISNEADLLQGSGEIFGLAAASRGRINYMEEVNYKMEEAAEMEEVAYIMLPVAERDLQVKEAFKKKRKGTL
jgi:hypothetical protein